MPAPGHTVLLGSGAAAAGSALENHTEGSAVALGHSRFLSTSQFLASVDQLILWGFFCSIAILPDPANSLRMSLETADTEADEQWSPWLSAGCSAAPPVLQKGLSQQHYRVEGWRLFLLCICVFTEPEQASCCLERERGACWGCAPLLPYRAGELNTEAFLAALAVLAGRFLFWLLAAPSVAPVPADGTSKCVHFPSFVAVCNPLY